MDDGARLRMNLRDRKASLWRISRTARYAVIIAGAILLVAIREGLERVSPGAGVAFGLGLRWLVALGWLICLALLWRHPLKLRIPLRWRLLGALATVWFLAHASYETYVALR